MVWSNNSKDYTWTPCGSRAGVVRARTVISNVFHILRDPYGAQKTRKRAVRCPYGHVRELKPAEFAKIPHGHRMWPYGAHTGPMRSPHGLFTGCLLSLNPYGARKLIMHALKLYGPCTGKQNSYGAAWAPCGPREWTYDCCSKQPVNNPGTTRTGPGSVICDWGITRAAFY